MVADVSSQHSGDKSKLAWSTSKFQASQSYIVRFYLKNKSILLEKIVLGLGCAEYFTVDLVYVVQVV